MKRFTSTLIIASVLFTVSSVFGQNFNPPKWIKGTWHNSYESNTHNFVFWNFSDDSIYVDKGLGFLMNKHNRESLNKKYSDYKLTTNSNNSTYQISFYKNKEKIVYEFKLRKVDYSEKLVLTYSLKVNGITKRKHFTSCNLVLTK